MESGQPDVRADHAAPGVALRAARVAQNLGVGEVARQLRLSVAQVEALESDAFERLPGPVFVRGFIRNYARLLKLDAELLLRSAALALAQAPDQGSPVPALARGEPMPVSRPVRWPRYVAVIVVLVIALAAYEWLFSDAPSEVKVTRPAPAVTAPAVVAPLPAEPSKPADATAGGAAGAPPEPVTADAPAPAPVAAPAEVASTPLPGTAELRFTFDGDSWVEIRDGSGRTLLSQVHRRGTEQRVQGQPPLALVVGNARAVRLTYNDREVDLEQYIKRDVARLTLQ